ncbi:MAG: hypothetical protein JXR55_02210 [Candidatus Fermentibacteraceae bacterium]|nr:hypothetical protein [Candidatus Fermentibacteraceae bacterium]
MSPATGTVKPTMQPPESGVAVRMYNTGFGDCFLLAFRAEKTDRTGDISEIQPVYMLIDCGVHHQYPGAEKRMKQVAEDIGNATGYHLHVVAITHEHTDHTYGFRYAKDIFDKFTIDSLWLSWAENPNDSVAAKLKDYYGMNIRALAGAITILRSRDDSLADTLENVLSFETEYALGASACESQLDYIRSRSIRKPECDDDYCCPGDPPRILPDVKGINIYVLGPPRNQEWIRMLEKQSELYPEFSMKDRDAALVDGILEISDSTSQDDEGPAQKKHYRPFNDSYGISLSVLKGESDSEKGRKPDDSEIAKLDVEFLRKFFKERYGYRKSGHAPEWRRIDSNWLAAAEQLAIKINSKINNTSLVLAIELADSRPEKVLLFTGDAQVGNWLSWQDLSWTTGEDEGVLSASDLLKHTVLYKVGHHGSRNATLNQKGLEMMLCPDLVAMLPVDEHWANAEKHWEHPAAKLLERLMKKTCKRIIRTDRIPNKIKPRRPEGIDKKDWDVLSKNIEWDRSGNKLWVQYNVTV